MHALVFQASLKPGFSPSDQDRELDGLVAFMKTVPGFVRGTWAASGQNAMSFLVFDSEEAALRVAANAKVPADATIEFRSSNVYEIARDV
ncbi:MAG TPA: hypothetical protein VFW71_10770 [Actinomycetota bacterium]|nr:hypothetical protein [Actinomycetota bacterium]